MVRVLTFLLFLLVTMGWNTSLLAQKIVVRENISNENEKKVDILIPLPNGSGSAIFKRNGYIYVIFDKEASFSNLDTPDYPLQEIEKIPSDSGTVLRFLVSPFKQWHVEQRKPFVILSFSNAPLEEEALPIYVEKKDNQIIFDISSSTKLIVTDHLIGEEMIIFPLIAHQHMPQMYASQAFEISETKQGLVFIPKIDEILSFWQNGKLVITSSNDLLMNDIVAYHSTDTRKIYDFSNHPINQEDFYKKRQRLENLIISIPSQARSSFKTEIARLFLSQNMASEAIGILQTVPEEDKDNDQKALEIVALFSQGKSIPANFLLKNHPEKSNLEIFSKIVEQPSIISEQEYLSWFNQMSPPLLSSFVLQALPLLLDKESSSLFSFFLKKMEELPLNPYQKQALSYYKAQEYLLNSNKPAMHEQLKKLTDNNVLSKEFALAHFQKIMLDIETNQVSLFDASQQLERLRFVYRHNNFEKQLLDTLSSLYYQQKDYIQALRALKRLFALTKENKISLQMKAFFKEALTADTALSAFQRLTVFHEFKELLPSGVDGDTIVAQLVNDLIDLDLLDIAYKMSLSLSQHYFDKIQREQSFLQTAGIALLNDDIQGINHAISFVAPSPLQKRFKAFIDKEKAENSLQESDIYFLHPAIQKYIKRWGWLQ